MLASVIVNEAARLLNDMEAGNEHVRWPVVDMLMYLTEGIAAIAQVKPSTFVVVSRLNLAPGSTQQLPEQYSRLLDIHFNVNRDGTEGSKVLPGVYALQQAFQKARCSSGTVIDSYSAYPGSERYFWVDPAVSTGLQYTPQVEALVMVAPQMVSSMGQSLFIPGSSPELYQAALVDWELYRCYLTDQESQTSFERAQASLRAFQAYLGVGVTQAVPKSSGQQRRAA